MWCKKTLELHPDRVQNPKREIRDINEAYSILAPISHGHIVSPSVFADIAKGRVSHIPEVGEKKGLKDPEKRIIYDRKRALFIARTF